MKEVVIISGVRTPVGRYMGALKTIEAYDLAALVMNAALQKAGVQPGDVDEVVFGQSYQNGEYGIHFMNDAPINPANPTRMVNMSTLRAWGCLRPVGRMPSPA